MLTTKELLSRLEEARIAYHNNPKDKGMINAYEAAYKAVFSIERIAAMNKQMTDAVPGIVVIDNPQNVTPIVWWPNAKRVIFTLNNPSAFVVQ